MDSDLSSAATFRRALGWTVLGGATALNVMIGAFAVYFSFVGSPDPSRRGATIVFFTLYIVVAVVSILAVVATVRRWNAAVVTPLKALTIGWAALIAAFIVVCLVFDIAV